MRQFAAAAEGEGLPLRMRVQVRSFDAMCRMVACGLGLAILPRSASPLYAKALSLRIVNLRGLETERRLLVAMRRREGLSTQALALLRILEEGGETTI